MLNSKEKHVLIVAGEASGDLHGSNLVRAMQKIDPAIFIQGIGGEMMKRAGVDILIPSSEMAVVGLTEVFSRINTIIKAHFELKRILKQGRPDLLILIDYPDFNIHLARCAKRFGVPVLYYISPQVWAWRKGRINKIARRVDRMAVILPFEKEYYQKTKLRVDYVGHPLLDAAYPDPQEKEIDRDMDITKEGPVIGLLPGSRNEEVERLLPLMIESMEIVSRRFPKLHCVLPVAPTISDHLIRSKLDKTSIDIRLTRNNVYKSLYNCDLAIVASGTATLETAIMNIPMVIMYKVSPLSYWIGRLFIDVSFIGLVNLVAGEGAVPELIQKDANALRLSNEALSILENNKIRNEMIAKLKGVREILGMGGASKRTAEIAIDMMEER